MSLLIDNQRKSTTAQTCCLTHVRQMETFNCAITNNEGKDGLFVHATLLKAIITEVKSLATLPIKYICRYFHTLSSTQLLIVLCADRSIRRSSHAKIAQLYEILHILLAKKVNFHKYA